MIDLTELRIEAQRAAGHGQRLGYYALEAADEIDRLRFELRQYEMRERFEKRREDILEYLANEFGK